MNFLKTMADVIGFCSLLFMVSLVGAPTARAEHTRVTNPNSLNLEVLGRGLLYSVNFDRVLNDDLAAGIGFGTVGLKTPAGGDTGNNTSLVPVYINYYFMKEQGSLFATVGATIVVNNNTANNQNSAYSGVTFTSSPVLPTFGLGYENRGDSGFLFRVTAYGFFANSFNPWAGFTMGFAF